ncbi:hypothetical protein APA_4200 [Pseudanabaena sp. lw0831]|nr:hypothetical protein [Pseudanabaena sp. lw0831]GBO55994.1 hypothetical protein APA_4200 [Pseudanabaena sp. lw0831]
MLKAIAPSHPQTNDRPLIPQTNDLLFLSDTLNVQSDRPFILQI